MGQIIPHSQSGKKFLRYLGLKNEKKLRCFENNWVSLDYLYERYGRSDSYKLFRKEFSFPRAREILHEWDNILTIDIGNGPEKEIPEYRVWFQEGRNSISSEGEQGFEDIGTTIWIRHSRLGTKIVTPEMWAQMENIMRYLDNAGAGPSNVGASSSLPPPA
ncbi:hypothetical protein H5410_047695 [Solanum commersonii]|uniref:Uncharacterized protein n=1 Tax=Solanum commersonii TaxID=4109 RepID=A0A9J5XHR4_SOLCO|nr:hypothetical protein H5410_047695 [Solanum commersonii]